jgi:hypothetical protein
LKHVKVKGATPAAKWILMGLVVVDWLPSRVLLLRLRLLLAREQGGMIATWRRNIH